MDSLAIKRQDHAVNDLESLSACMPHCRLHALSADCAEQRLSKKRSSFINVQLYFLMSDPVLNRQTRPRHCRRNSRKSTEDCLFVAVYMYSSNIPYERGPLLSDTSRSRDDVVHTSRIHKTRPYSNHHRTSQFHINTSWANPRANL